MDLLFYLVKLNKFYESIIISLKNLLIIINRFLLKKELLKKNY